MLTISELSIESIAFSCGYQSAEAFHKIFRKTEQADQDAVILVDDEKNKKSTAGTVSYMPAVFGCYLAEYVIRRI